MNNKPTSNPFLTRSHRAVVDALWDNMVHSRNPHYGDFRKNTGGYLEGSQWKARQLRGKSVSEFHNSSNKGEVVQANHNNNACDKSYDFDGIGNRNKTADSLTLPAATDGSPATAGTVKVDYDHMGRRFRKTVTTGGVTKYSYFIYSGNNALAKYTGNSQSALSLQKSYYWGKDLGGGEGTGGMLAEVKHLGTDNLELATPQTLFALMDGNGNVTEYLKSDGTLAAHFEYDSFGNTLVSEGAEAGVVDYGFSSRAKDKDLGLVYYNYRYYNAVQGSWINRDPIDEEGGVNIYGFVGNNGTTNWDYLGFKLALHGAKADVIADYRKAIKNREMKLPMEGNRAVAGVTSGKMKVTTFCMCSVLGGDKNDKHELQIDGYLRIKVLYYLDAIDKQKNGVVAHEQLHVNVYAKYWNQLVAKVNPYEKEYDSLEACNKAAQTVLFNQITYIRLAELANIAIDNKAY